MCSLKYQLHVSQLSNLTTNVFNSYAQTRYDQRNVSALLRV